MDLALVFPEEQLWDADAHSAVTKPRLRWASRGTIYHILDGRVDHGPIK